MLNILGNVMVINWSVSSVGVLLITRHSTSEEGHGFASEDMASHENHHENRGQGLIVSYATAMLANLPVSKLEAYHRAEDA